MVTIYLFRPPMPNTNRPLHFVCPKCQHDGCLLVVKSLTVMTWTCESCRYTWATDMQSLPPDIQARVPDAIDHLDQLRFTGTQRSKH